MQIHVEHLNQLVKWPTAVVANSPKITTVDVLLKGSLQTFVVVPSGDFFYKDKARAFQY